MKKNSTKLILSSLLALSLVTSLVAGIHREEKAKPIDEKKLMGEAYLAVHTQVILNLPYRVRPNTNMLSRRKIMPDPYYRAEFTKVDPKDKEGKDYRHLEFTLKRSDLGKKEVVVMTTGYYEAATKTVYLKHPKKNVFVSASRHPLLMASVKPEASKIISKTAAKGSGAEARVKERAKGASIAR